MRSEKRVADFDVGVPPAYSAWDPADPTNLAVVSRGANETYLMLAGDSGSRRFRKGYTRRYIPMRHLRQIWVLLIYTYVFVLIVSTRHALPIIWTGFLLP